jgi:nucleotide-binding universal stress UspA family protein
MSNPAPSQGIHPTPALEEHAADPFVERVVFATDGGPAGAGATRWIEHRAKMHRLDIQIEMVVELDWMTQELSGAAFTDAADAIVEAAKEYLGRTAPSARVETDVTWGEPRERLEQVSEHADLIVVGTSRSGRLAGMLGSTFPVKLAESARCPAIVVPKKWKPGRGAVVVGIQGDDYDDPALRFAIHEARVLHRPLKIVHAWEIPPMQFPAGLLADRFAHAPNPHQAVLARVVDAVRQENPDLEVTGLLVEEASASALIHEAAGAELLVVGSHGLTVADRLFIGSVSREILSRPPCPVAVIRPKAHPRAVRPAAPTVGEK